VYKRQRINDVVNLNQSISKILADVTSEELIKIFNEIGLPIGKINSIPEVLEDSLIKRGLLKSKDSKSGLELTLAPPPYITPFLEDAKNTLSFPPRFGEHNSEIYCNMLGYSQSDLVKFKEEGVI